MGGWEYGQVLAVEYPKVTDAQAIIVRDDKTLDISPAVTIVAWAKLSRLPSVDSVQPQNIMTTRILNTIQDTCP